MLETTHTRDYYLSMAERYPPFEAVIAGDDSLVCWLDSIAEDCWNEYKEKHAERIEALCCLCGDSPSSGGNLPKESIVKLFAGLTGYAAAGSLVPYLAGTAAMTFIPPPLGVVIGLPLVAIGSPLGGFLTGLFGTAMRQVRIVEGRKEALQPLYATAEPLDADISRCFIIGDFQFQRERFGQTYLALAQEERADVEADLHRMLSAGALDMGEAELDRYLAGLAGKEETHDD